MAGKQNIVVDVRLVLWFLKMVKQFANGPDSIPVVPKMRLLQVDFKDY